MTLKISVEEVELVTHRLARKLLRWNEPIPDFSTRFPNVLESCLSAPFQTYSRRLLYHTLADQTAALFYLMIKNHPFQNGNKRIAITTLFYFLYKNHKWIKIDNQELYNFAVWVAKSPSPYKEEVILAIKKFIHQNVVERTS